MNLKSKQNFHNLFFSLLKQHIIMFSEMKSVISDIYKTDKYSQKFTKDITFYSIYLRLISIFLHDINYGTLLGRLSIYDHSPILVYISTLDEMKQKIFIMFINGNTYKEISKETGLPEKEIKIKIYDLIRGLKMHQYYCINHQAS